MRFSFCLSEFLLVGRMIVFLERCHANITCVGVALYFSARDTISGWSRTGEYPAQFEELVCLDR